MQPHIILFLDLSQVHLFPRQNPPSEHPSSLSHEVVAMFSDLLPTDHGAGIPKAIFLSQMRNKSVPIVDVLWYILIEGSVCNGGGKMVVRLSNTLNKVMSFWRDTSMNAIHRITLNPEVMGGKPCIRGMRVTVGTLIGLLASGYTHEDVLRAYPYLEEEDIRAALSYAAWRTEEVEVVLESA